MAGTVCWKINCFRHIFDVIFYRKPSCCTKICISAPLVSELYYLRTIQICLEQFFEKLILHDEFRKYQIYRDIGECMSCQKDGFGKANIVGLKYLKWGMQISSSSGRIFAWQMLSSLFSFNCNIAISEDVSFDLSHSSRRRYITLGVNFRSLFRYRWKVLRTLLYIDRSS